MTMSGQRVVRLAVVLVCLVVMVLSVLPSNSAYAAQITNRTLTLEGQGTTGGSTPSGTVKHKFDFTIPTNGTLGSIQFLYCKTASGSCTTPAGLTTTGATLSNQSGATSFALDATTNGAPFIHRTAASTGAPNTVVSYELSSVVNPNNTNCFGGTTPQSNNCTFYVRITTFTGEDGVTGPVDTGTVAASTVTQISLTGTMPESLIFCTGGTISTTSGIPDCSTATSGSISFNQLFSPADTATAHNQMAASTNADSGYAITYNGATLTSGSNTVTAMSSATTGIRGTRQFGLNLVTNTTTTSTPAVGADITPASNASNYKAKATAGYNTPDTFKFTTSGDTIAQSNDGGTLGPTDVQLYTVSYMVNVSGGQPIGTYTTTLTYICTATF